MKSATALLLLLCSCPATVLVAAPNQRSAASSPPVTASTIKAQLAKMPVLAPLDARLLDGRKLRGRLGPASEDFFVLHLSRNGVTVEEKIAFQDVASVHRRLSKAAKVGIGAAVGGGAFYAVLMWISYHI